MDPPGKLLKTEPETLSLHQDIYSPAAETDLSEEAVSAMSTLQGEMRGVFDMFDYHFRKLVNAHELGCGVRLQKRVQLMLCAQSYSIRRASHYANLNCDHFDNTDHADLIDKIARLFMPGGQAHSFCSTKDLSTKTLPVRAHKTEVGNENPGSVKGPEDFSNKSGHHYHDHTSNHPEHRTFQLDANLVHYTRTRGNYCQIPRTQNVGFIYMVDVEIHFWKRGVPQEIMLNMLQYDTPH